jgi:hypothetical protein
MAYVGKLEPSVLVIPNYLRTELVPEALPIEVEDLQEDVVVEAVDCHGSGGSGIVGSREPRFLSEKIS